MKFRKITISDCDFCPNRPDVGSQSIYLEGLNMNTFNHELLDSFLRDYRARYGVESVQKAATTASNRQTVNRAI